jgi:exopolysaccharide biosynthesis polyprenyl glycosylphosphotransferase
MEDKKTNRASKNMPAAPRHAPRARRHPEVSITIITWNSRQLLHDCLESIYAGTRKVDFEIIVVDNGSRDGTVEMLHQRFPKVRLIKNAANRGVAPARNQALRVAKGDFVLILDADTRVLPGAIDDLAAFAQSTPEAGIVGAKMIDPDGALQLTCRRFPTIFTPLLRRLQFIPLFRNSRTLRDQVMADWDHNSIREVDYVIGACQLIRREVIAEVGFLDENIFYGPEDVDYCLRAQSHGWKVYYYPNATIMHYERRITRNFFRAVSWKHLWAVFYFFQKHGYLFNAKNRDYAIIMPRVIEGVLLGASDLTAITAAFLLWAWFRGKMGLYTITDPTQLFTSAVLIAAFWFVLFLFFGLYRAWSAHSRFDELVKIVKTVFFGVVLIFLLTFDFERDFTTPPTRGRLLIVTYWLLMSFMVANGRLVLRTVQRRLLEAGIGVRRTLIVGWNKKARALLDKIKRFPALGYRVVGFVDVNTPKAHQAYGEAPVIGSIRELSRIIQEQRVENVLIALDMFHRRQVTEVVNQCTELPVTLKIIPDLYSIVMGQARTNQIYGFPLIEIFPQIMPLWQRRSKRLLDVTVSLAVLALGLPLWLLLAAAIWLDSPGPIFSRQKRVGKDGRIFRLIRFRVKKKAPLNSNGKPATGKNNFEITRTGRFLRQWHLEKIPQFLNVLAGEMSLVGPRPAPPRVVEKLKKEVPFYMRRLKVQPGLTGWAQVQAADHGAMEGVKQKLQYDFFYVENMSLAMDVKILLSAVYRMLIRRDIK